MIPAHLKRYVVEQDYSRYTPVDQAVWRYIMRQLKSFLSEHAHPCYVDGLAKTGISVEKIPNIQEMSQKLETFGWHAIPVSGFIPPAAFMELQSLGYLPIASDMRTVNHLMYTPAPDIVHEAAGHAPILIEPEFAEYLKAYAQVARKAIISHEDMDQYEAIRALSDLKEDPHSTPEQIQEAERRLESVSNSISHVSEAAYLGRMNWWTAEYGLIGTLENPKIFGAGLLSSVGEAKSCLSSKVKKIPFSIDCLNYSYDITEPQPQLFVTPSFEHLRTVLEELAATMAFRRGGAEGLEKAKLAQTVNTVELDSGLQISGRLKEYLLADQEPAYLQFEGPTQLCADHDQLPGQGPAAHPHGFGSPVGLLENSSKSLAEMTDAELKILGVTMGSRTELRFKSGVRVKGKVTGWLRHASGRLLVLSFSDCTVTKRDTLLFDPAWGTFDMAVGTRVMSVFGGPADRGSYGRTDDFVAKIIPRKQWPPLMQHKHRLYSQVREIRGDLMSGAIPANQEASDRLEAVLEELESDFPHDWLLRLELLELSTSLPSDSWAPRVDLQLKNLAEKDPEVRANIEDGVRGFGVY